MTSAAGSEEKIPSSAVELQTESPTGWPGAAITVHVNAKEDDPSTRGLNVSLTTLEGQPIVQTAPYHGTAVLRIPHDCKPGDYLLSVSEGNWCLDSLPFEITSRRVAELTRQLLRASVLQADAFAAAEDSASDPEKVSDLASEAERLYVACGEARLARRTWEEISDAFRQRGLHRSAREAAARARALEPKDSLKN